ncbi:MAG: extracellular solute-binding protein, partial [Clostridia bacterium]|nr:extracellular solute-binding protein [Clostridia bacterium]
EDVIRALNTELLSGKAPDILLLDGLPVDSYIGKNVLLDLTAMVEEMVATQGLLENLMGAYAKDGKIYGVPARFTFPVMMGDGEAMDGIGSLEDLVGQVKAHQGDKVPFLKPPLGLWEDNGMLMNYYSACVSGWSDGRAVDQSALERYLESALTLNTVMREHTPQLGGSEAMAAVTVVSASGASGFEELNYGPMALARNQARFHIQELGGMMNLRNIVSSLSGKAGYRMDSLFGGNAYTPVGGVGIVASGKQQDLAKDFVEMLLSDTVQAKYLYDGFPVNGKSLDKMTAEQLKDSGPDIISMISGGQDASAAPPAEAGSDMGFAELCRKLDTPILTDGVIKAAVEAQAKGLLDGSLTPKAAAENVVKSTELYRAE